MVTVGGMIADARDQERRARCCLSTRFDYVSDGEQVKIDAPPLTHKEKLALDQMLPSAEPPTESEVEAIGFKLKKSQIASYHRYYKQYPLFLEFYP